MIAIQTPDGAQTVANASILTAEGAKDIARGSILTPDGSKDFFVAGGGAGLTLEASPISATGSGGSSGDITVTTNQVTVNVTGGTAPYTFAWAKLTGISSWAILSATSAATRFSVTVATSSVEDGSFRCTVTDARGRTATTDINAFAYNFGSLGGF